jgi:hypothetical protein
MSPDFVGPTHCLYNGPQKPILRVVAPRPTEASFAVNNQGNSIRRAGMYLRVSTKGQETDNQLLQMQRFIEAQQRLKRPPTSSAILKQSCGSIMQSGALDGRRDSTALARALIPHLPTRFGR